MPQSTSATEERSVPVCPATKPSGAVAGSSLSLSAMFCHTGIAVKVLNTVVCPT